MWLNGVLWCGFIDSFSGTFTQVTIIHVYGLFICLFFGVLGYLVTILMKRAKSIVGPAIGIVMGMYFLDMIIRIADKAQFVLWFTPYKYMNIDLLNPEYHMEWWNLLVTGGATALMVGASYYFYSKKDILI